MFLDKLLVENIFGFVREIPFKKGLNLILDSSVLTDKNETGNNVGKTTVLRVIDFCFGSEGKDIYTDKEFKTINEEVYTTLVTKKYRFTLTLYNKGNKLKLSRGFDADNKVLFINDEECDDLKSYSNKIKSFLFRSNELKPTLRQLMPKFIRKDTHTMSNAMYYLHSTTSKVDYEMIYLTLFGFEDSSLINERFGIAREIKKLEKRITALKSGKTISAAKQRLRIIEKNITSVEKEISEFKIGTGYERELERLHDIKEQVSYQTKKISSLKLKISLNKTTQKELSKSKESIDIDVITSIYNEAKYYNPEINKSLEELIVFHNKMIDQKLVYVSKSIENASSVLNGYEQKLSKSLNLEREIIQYLSDRGTLSDLQKMQKELNIIYTQKGELASLINLVEELDEEKKQKNLMLLKYNERLDDYVADFEEKISKFNDFYSELSKELYNEIYYVSDGYDKGAFDFTIDNLKGNVGGGKKKGQVAAFDFALVKFIDFYGYNYPRFIFHDSIEDIHKNQIETLFSTANSLEGQYIVSMLEDKITFLGSDFIKENSVIRLSPSDRFFKF